MPSGGTFGERILHFRNRIYRACIDESVKSRNSIEFVIPAKAGIQLFQGVLDPGFRRGDDSKDFLRDHHVLVELKKGRPLALACAEQPETRSGYQLSLRRTALWLSFR
jgi:hypothetical protein